jgi:phage terminase small subunit
MAAKSTSKSQKPAEDPQLAHLSASSRAWYDSVVATWKLEPHHLHLLRLAAESLDSAARAGETLRVEGSYFRDRWGNIKPHPALAQEVAARGAYARLVKSLGLDFESPRAGPGRPGKGAF